MDEILKLAEDLGKRVAGNERVQRYVKAREAFEKSAAARQLIQDYENQQRKVMELEAHNKPIEPEDKRALSDLHQKVAADPALKELLRAQADYIELMNRVSDRIESQALKTRSE